MVVGNPFESGLGQRLKYFSFHEIYLANPQLILDKLEQYESSYSAVADAVGLDAVEEIERDASEDMTLTHQVHQHPLNISAYHVASKELLQKVIFAFLF